MGVSREAFELVPKRLPISEGLLLLVPKHVAGHAARLVEQVGCGAHEGDVAVPIQEDLDHGGRSRVETQWMKQQVQRLIRRFTHVVREAQPTKAGLSLMHGRRHDCMMIGELLPIFRADRVASVVDADGWYLGLVKKIDLINYLRLRLD